MNTKTKPPGAPELPEFQQYQFAFTRHIRDPQHQPRPSGVTARRMKVYNELLYNNLESFLLACFPVTRKVLGARKWARLVRDFFAVHRCRTPLFRQIPEEFVQYLHEERGEMPQDPPYLRNLAHYEWIELALSVSTREPELKDVDVEGNLFDGKPALNPVLSLLNYAYPVHRIGPKFKPSAAQQEDTHLLVFRDPDDRVRFVVLNPVSARLVALLQTSACTGREALLRIAEELQHPDPAAVIAGGLEILENLRRENAIMGTHHGRI